MPIPRRYADRSSQQGFTIIELMIAVALGLVLILTMLGSLQTSTAINRSNQRTAELQTNGQYALEVLRRGLLHSGFKGMTYSRPTQGTTGAVTSDCAVGFTANLAMGIWGANDANPFAATCIPAARYARGDILVVRRAAQTPAVTLASNMLYLRSAYERGVVFRGDSPPTFTETPVQDLALEQYVYFISPWTTDATENPLTPALYRVRLNPGPTLANPELVAAGIENLQVQYARSLTNGTVRYYNANTLSTAGSTQWTPSEWDEVHSVRIWLLARATTTEIGYRNTTTYQMGDNRYTVNDSFRRQLYSTVISLRNNTL